jgi:hypothetical protein
MERRKRVTFAHIFCNRYDNAFHDVINNLLWEIVLENHFPSHLIRASQSPCLNNDIKIRTAKDGKATVLIN